MFLIDFLPFISRIVQPHKIPSAINFRYILIKTDVRAIDLSAFSLHSDCRSGTCRGRRCWKYHSVCQNNCETHWNNIHTHIINSNDFSIGLNWTISTLNSDELNHMHTHVALHLFPDCIQTVSISTLIREEKKKHCLFICGNHSTSTIAQIRITTKLDVLFNSLKVL